ncbi:MAG TPA: hypothetical protein VFD27_01420 [Chthoniobacteraceae bacterium]|nr:hypothetical protein [Chthoniobacteraceae bacterium]
MNLSQPFGLRFGADGNLYEISGNSASVERFHGVTGAYVDTSIPSGTGSLNLPNGALFGTDGYLYVASFNNSKVARFEPTNGAALGDFVAAGSGGLTGPNFMLFRPPVVATRPPLAITVSNSEVSLSWPTAAVGWSLQSTLQLDSPPAWSPVADFVSKSNGSFLLTLPRTADAQFFRLILP